MKPDDMDAVFHALSSSARRRILDILTSNPGAPVGEVADRFDMSRIAVMKHLRVLEDAGLVTSKKQGRTRRLFFNAVPIQLIHERWTTEFARLWAGHMTAIKYRAEQTHTKSKPDQGATDHD